MTLVEDVAARLRAQVPSRAVYELAVPDGPLPTAYLLLRGMKTLALRVRHLQVRPVPAVAQHLGIGHEEHGNAFLQGVFGQLGLVLSGQPQTRRGMPQNDAWLLLAANWG